MKASAPRHRPLRKWGQNFLRNHDAARRIAEAVAPEAGDLVLEIGPGEGVLTGELLRFSNRIVAIEIDPGLARALEDRFPANRLTVVRGDAMEVPLPEQRFCAVGNLPYNVGTSILRKVIANPFCRRAVFMLQKEVADRILASPGSPDYGFLTLFVAVFARPSRLLTLGPGSFHPPPKVRSSVVVLEVESPPLESAPESLLELISAAFRMRRKKLINNLQGYRGLSRQQLAAVVEVSRLDAHARAESLTLAQFDDLACAIERAVRGHRHPRPRPRGELP